MWPTRQQSPLRLSGIAVGGTFLYVVTVLVIVLCANAGASWLNGLELGRASWLLRLAAVIALFLPGIVIAFRALSLLKEGIRLDR